MCLLSVARAKVRVQPASGFLPLPHRGDGRWGCATIPLSLLPPPRVFVFSVKLDCRSQGNKSNFPPSHCHLLGFHPQGRLLLFSQCLPPTPRGAWDSLHILPPPQCDRAQEPKGAGAPQQLEGELSGKGLVLAAGGGGESLMDYSAGREGSP